MSSKLAVLSARLEPKYINALNKVAKAQGISKAQLLRAFASDAESLYIFLQEKQREKIKLDGNLAQWILEHMPPGATTETLEVAATAINHALIMMRESQAGKAEEAEEEPQP